jgi:hypothetical protein
MRGRAEPPPTREQSYCAIPTHSSRDNSRVEPSRSTGRPPHELATSSKPPRAPLTFGRGGATTAVSERYRPLLAGTKRISTGERLAAWGPIKNMVRSIRRWPLHPRAAIERLRISAVDDLTNSTIQSSIFIDIIELTKVVKRPSIYDIHDYVIYPDECHALCQSVRATSVGLLRCTSRTIQSS